MKTETRNRGHVSIGGAVTRVAPKSKCDDVGGTQGESGQVPPLPISILRGGGRRRCRAHGIEEGVQAGRSVADARGGLRGHVGGFRVRVLRGKRSSAGRGAISRGGSCDGRTAETALKEKTWPGWSVVI